MSTEVSALGEVLAQQSVRVLVRAALPRALRVAEEYLQPCVDALCLLNTPSIARSSSLYPDETRLPSRAEPHPRIDSRRPGLLQNEAPAGRRNPRSAAPTGRPQALDQQPLTDVLWLNPRYAPCLGLRLLHGTKLPAPPLDVGHQLGPLRKGAVSALLVEDFEPQLTPSDSANEPLVGRRPEEGGRKPLKRGPFRVVVDCSPCAHQVARLTPTRVRAMAGSAPWPLQLEWPEPPAPLRAPSAVDVPAA
jgi:hypothetical protein